MNTHFNCIEIRPKDDMDYDSYSAAVSLLVDNLQLNIIKVTSYMGPVYTEIVTDVYNTDLEELVKRILDSHIDYVDFWLF